MTVLMRKTLRTQIGDVAVSVAIEGSAAYGGGHRCVYEMQFKDHHVRESMDVGLLARARDSGGIIDHVEKALLHRLAIFVFEVQA